MSYNKTVYANNTPPAINSDNLNKSENELAFLDTTIENFMGIIPYVGGLTAINADTSVDTSKLYFVDVPGTLNNLKIMEYRSGEWVYTGDKIKKLGYVIDITDIQNLSGALPYNGGLPDINADPSVNTSKLYYVNTMGTSTSLSIMKYNTSSNQWEYNGKINILKDTANNKDMMSYFESVIGAIPYYGGIGTIANDPSVNTSKKYLMCVPTNANRRKIMVYENNEWRYEGKVSSELEFEDKYFNIVGALPYPGGQTTINNDTEIDKTKAYYVNIHGANYLRKMVYDSTQSKFVYSGKVSGEDIWKELRTLVGKVVGAYPYYGGTTIINEDSYADTTKMYFVADSTSQMYLTTMIYDGTAWVYGEDIATLYNLTLNGGGSGSDELYIENTKVKEYLENTLYDDSDYSYTNVLDYAANDLDHPTSKVVVWESESNPDSFKVYYAINGDFSTAYAYSLAGSIRNFSMTNMRPDKTAVIKVCAVNSGTETVVKSMAVHPKGQVRMLSVGGIRNVRDIGGWKCENGRIKYGKIFRGSAIDETGSTITEDGKIVLYNLMNVRAEIDLRSTGTPTTSIIGANCTRYRITGYSYLNGYNNTTDAYNVLSRIFTEVANGNVIYLHCSGGCDRTAFYICMIEGLLGVSENDINKDFELSSFMNMAYSNNYRRYRSMGVDYSNRDWKGLMDLIKAGSGNTWQEKFYNYFIGIGFTAEEITAFKNAMMEA